MKNVQTITDLDNLVLAQIVQINKNKFLNLGFEVGDDIYMVAIPDVMVKKYKKEEKKDGESGVRHSGIQETAVSEEKDAVVNDGEEDPGSDESQNQGAETQQEIS